MLESLLNEFIGVDISNTEEVLKRFKSESYPRFNPNPKDKPYKAIIRFLPNLKDSSKNLDKHSIPEKSYWLESEDEKVGVQSPTMVGQQCMIGDTWRKYKNKEDAVSKAIKDKLKLNTSFYSLVYVIQDFNNPSNDGKIMVWKYGVKVRQKLEQLVAPTEEEVAMGSISAFPFDLLDGCNFRISTKMVAGWANYDDCAFTQPTQFSLVLGGKENITNSPSVKQALIDLYESAPDIDTLFAFKPWTSDQTEKVKRILNYITGGKSASSSSMNTVMNTSEDEYTEDEVVDDDMDEFLNGL